MLNWYYDMYKIKEQNLSRSAIMRMRVFTLMSIPALPLLSIGQFFDIPLWGHFLCLGLGIISAIIATIVLTGTITNTFTRTNKNLDEWEIRHKQAAESFSYRFILWISVAGAVMFGFLSLRNDFSEYIEFQITLDANQICYVFMNIMMLLFLVPPLHAAWTIKPLDQTPTI